MKQSIEMIGPDQAKLILLNNSINRKQRVGWIKDLCDLINRGEWLCTHQGIAISTTGDLLDGQHRLEAIAMSGKTVPVVVWRDVSKESFGVIDRGVIRTMSDCTRIKKRTVEVLNFLHYSSTGRASKPTASQILKLYEVFGKTADELHEYAPTATKTFGSVGVRAATVFLTLKGNTKCFEIYRKMSLSEFGEMPNIINVFIKKAVSGTLISRSQKGGGFAQLEVFHSALFALNHVNYEKSRIPAITDASLKEIRFLIVNFLNGDQS